MVESSHRLVETDKGWLYINKFFPLEPYPEHYANPNLCIDTLKAAGVDFTVEYLDGTIDYYLGVE